MPVTAKLSKAFYQKLGHDVTDELVDYLNEVDAAYRTDLRDLNELNFARFDAKLEQRIAELRATLREEIAGLRTDLKGDVAGVRNEVRAAENRLLTWMFAAWATTIGTLIALLRLWG